MAKLYVTSEQFEWFQQIMNDPTADEPFLISRVKGMISCLVLGGKSEGLESGQISLVGTPFCPQIELIVERTK